MLTIAERVYSRKYFYSQYEIISEIFIGMVDLSDFILFGLKLWRKSII